MVELEHRLVAIPRPAHKNILRHAECALCSGLECCPTKKTSTYIYNPSASNSELYHVYSTCFMDVFWVHRCACVAPHQNYLSHMRTSSATAPAPSKMCAALIRRLKKECWRAWAAGRMAFRNKTNTKFMTLRRAAMPESTRHPKIRKHARTPRT